MEASGTRGERELVEALRRGDESAFARVVQENSGRMGLAARRILRHPDDANDAVQEAFLQAFRAIGRFEGDSKLSTWLHRITVNTCLLRLRHARRRPEAALGETFPGVDEPVGHSAGAAAGDGPGDVLERMERDEIAQVVREAIERLPDNLRVVLTLRDLEGRPTAETAKVLGIRSEAAKMRLHRARQALRMLLEPELLDRVA